jgi:L-alanine-DL-glutamate epimerase-like enolase superfamily enzyme
MDDDDHREALGATAPARRCAGAWVRRRAMVKVVDVSLTLFRWPGVEESRYHGPAAAARESDLGLLRIVTDEGTEGHAFLGSSMKPASLDAHLLMRWLAPLLLGADPLRREHINVQMGRVSRLVGMRCIGAVDVALWDLAGKATGQPVHVLLGGFRTSLPAYASSQRLNTVEEYVEQAQQLKAEGWPAYKIHPPMRPDLDVTVCSAVRDAVGHDYRLMLDSTWAYDYVDAVRVGRAIEGLGFYWYEDPLADSDIHNYVRLREKLDIAVMATEYPVGGLRDYAVWITQRATDYLRGDIPNKGGITTMIKTAHLAEAFGMRYEIHHSGNSLNNLANLQVSVALRNCEMFEVLQPDGAHKYGLLEEVEIDPDGLVHVPEGPGLGGTIDDELVRAMTIETLR